jgi:hypothetical protein
MGAVFAVASFISSFEIWVPLALPVFSSCETLAD